MNNTTTSAPIIAANEAAKCVLRMDQLQEPFPLIYGTISVFGGLVASVGNLLVIIIIWRPKQSTHQSNKILSSLAVFDMLVGAILFPMISIQLLASKDLLRNCVYDYIREYVTTVTIGSSLMTLGIVSYDRYILMTELGHYKDIMTRRKIIVLIVLAWVLPGVSPTLRFLGKGPFLYCVIFITLGPLIILLLTYYKIVKCIQQSSARIRSHHIVHPASPGSIPKKKQQQKEPGPAGPHQQHDGAAPGPGGNLSTKRSERRNIKLAKAVSLLILVYCMCLIPSSVWSICDIIQMSHPFTDTPVIQKLYVFACTAGGTNSALNPLIYFFKQPDMRRGFKRLFSGLTKRKATVHTNNNNKRHNEQTRCTSTNDTSPPVVNASKHKKTATTAYFVDDNKQRATEKTYSSQC